MVVLKSMPENPSESKCYLSKSLAVGWDEGLGNHGTGRLGNAAAPLCQQRAGTLMVRAMLSQR